jgi:hypothetical protein
VAEELEDLRATELWQVLDWSLWGNGLGDVLRTAMADTMIAALPVEQREQAEACIKAWHERRGPSMAVGEGTELQRQRDLLLWLHAEAVHWREFESAAAESAEEDNNRLRSELKRLHSWAGLMELLDEHWPAEVFDGQSEDSGPRIVSLIRAVDSERSSRQAWAEEAMRLDTLTNPPQATEDEVGDIVYEFGNLNTTLTESVTEKLFEFFDIRPKPLRRQGEPLTKRVCACPPKGAVFPGKWTPPQCAVHPGGE